MYFGYEVKIYTGNFLVVQWLRLHAFIAKRPELDHWSGN